MPFAVRARRDAEGIVIGLEADDPEISTEHVTLISPDHDPEAILALLGDRGHIALEVHDNAPLFGDARWGVGAQCRWRNIHITEL